MLGCKSAHNGDSRERGKYCKPLEHPVYTQRLGRFEKPGSEFLPVSRDLLEYETPTVGSTQNWLSAIFSAAVAGDSPGQPGLDARWVQ